ncbi:hypothetical protein N7541_010717 [Penicillium brevicompactum]|uniref:Uncharacterized protein n=1 Tax=Penicillium brevicompactum TaxID=5074 RepID=A0A9W9QP91_PENBR|nr:hypothetical protein N7541_010717 [Penicillium brevicompactum]
MTQTPICLAPLGTPYEPKVKKLIQRLQAWHDADRVDHSLLSAFAWRGNQCPRISLGSKC